jgi:hypothetical protein
VNEPLSFADFARAVAEAAMSAQAAGGQAPGGGGFMPYGSEQGSMPVPFSARDSGGGGSFVDSMPGASMMGGGRSLDMSSPGDSMMGGGDPRFSWFGDPSGDPGAAGAASGALGGGGGGGFVPYGGGQPSAPPPGLPPLPPSGTYIDAPVSSGLAPDTAGTGALPRPLPGTYIDAPVSSGLAPDTAGTGALPPSTLLPPINPQTGGAAGVGPPGSPGQYGPAFPPPGTVPLPGAPASSGGGGGGGGSINPALPPGFDPRNPGPFLGNLAAASARAGLGAGYGMPANFSPGSGMLHLTQQDIADLAGGPAAPRDPATIPGLRQLPGFAGGYGYNHPIRPEDIERLRPRLSNPGAPLAPVGAPASAGGAPGGAAGNAGATGATGPGGQFQPGAAPGAAQPGTGNDPQTQALITIRQFADTYPDMTPEVRAQLEKLTAGVMANNPADLAAAVELAGKMAAPRPPVPGAAPATGGAPATGASASGRPPVPGGTSAAPAPAQPPISSTPSAPPIIGGTASTAEAAGPAENSIAAGGVAYPAQPSGGNRPVPAPGGLETYQPGTGPVGRQSANATGMGPPAPSVNAGFPVPPPVEGDPTGTTPDGAPAAATSDAGTSDAPITTVPAATAGAQWPVARNAYPITTEPGYDTGPATGRGPGHFHNGVDIGVPQGTPLAAPASGRVLQATDSGDGYGNKVVIEGDDRNTYILGHLSQVGVQAGSTVQQGQPIGLSGGQKGTPGAGISTGSHVHFEVRDPYGRQVDPRTIGAR